MSQLEDGLRVNEQRQGAVSRRAGPMPEAAMSMRLRCWLAGMTLLVGGVTAGSCHLLNSDSTADVGQLVLNAPLRGPIHLAVFAGGMLVLLGWFGYYSLEKSRSAAIGLAFVCLFLGVMWADLLHSILEFSIFPVLEAVAPYALPRLAEATYRSVPVSFLLVAGQCLLFAGVPLAAWAIYRTTAARAWPAIPFALTAALQAAALIPQWGATLHTWSLTALYFSLATLGVAVLWSARTRSVSAFQAAQDRTAISYEDSQPAAR